MTLNYPALPADHPINQIDKEAFKKQDGRFSPKLSARERCEVLALLMSGLSVPLVAAAYGIDRRTASHIGNPASPHYRSTRAKLAQMGEAAFIAEFVTSEVMDRVNRAAKEKGEEIRASTRRKYEKAKEPTEPNKNARKHAGMHVVKTEFTSYSHRIEVAWRDDQEWGAGWYYRDLDSSDPDMWLHNGDESRLTSTLCLAAVKQNLMD